MTITKTHVALIAAGSLALGIGGSWLLTRPSEEPAPNTLETPGAVQPEIEPVALAPAATADAPSETPGPARILSAEPPRPSPQVARRPAAPVPAPQMPAPKSAGPALDAPAPAPPVVAAEVTASDPPPSAEPLFEELVVSANSVLGLRIDSAISSEDASVEDRVTATVTRDVRVGDRVAIPTGAIAHGEVTFVARGGKLKERARLGVRFTSIVLGNGTRVPIDTGEILREGASAGKESTAKIGGGALGGAIIGGIIGGRKGAAIGSTVGAGAGTAAVMAGGRNAATLEAGEPVSVQLTKPAVVTVDR